MDSEVANGLQVWAGVAVSGAIDGRDMGCQRQLYTVDDNAEIASGIRDGDASAEHQDVMAVDLVQQLTWAQPQQLRLRRV